MKNKQVFFNISLLLGLGFASATYAMEEGAQISTLKSLKQRCLQYIIKPDNMCKTKLCVFMKEITDAINQRGVLPPELIAELCTTAINSVQDDIKEPEYIIQIIAAGKAIDKRIHIEENLYKILACAYHHKQIALIKKWALQQFEEIFGYSYYSCNFLRYTDDTIIKGIATEINIKQNNKVTQYIISLKKQLNTDAQAEYLPKEIRSEVARLAKSYYEDVTALLAYNDTILVRR